LIVLQSAIQIGGVPAAVAVYALNVLVIAATGHAMSRLIPGVTPGMIMEMPGYRPPAIGMLGRKVWFRVREFVVVAWPLLIAGSVILGIAEWLQWTSFVDRLLQPLTVALGLPMTVGTVLVFGILRKELAPVMLMQAIGTTHVLTVL
jgi:ferrous iron transport protein B